MCGFAGIFIPQSNELKANRQPLLEAMTDAIAHRGPDGSGHWHDAKVSLGHRRLSIIDVATGQQPLFNEDGSVVVVFNGEIYNYVELANELKALGHTFKTLSDTEVIVHAWEQWGTDSVSRFNGMFAFALWDQRTKTLFMARDRLGVKPLYYATTKNNQIVFGSELKSLMIHPQFDRTIQDDAVADYFALGYVPDPKAIFSNSFKLAPAHWLLWKADTRKPTIQSYWAAQFTNAMTGTDEALCDELRARLKQSVKSRMISEVPLGAFLSGGVDSSAVVATMAQVQGTPVTTCSIGFDQAQFDETTYANEVAERYKTDHFARIVSAADFDLLDKLAGMYDEPFADSSAIPTLRVSQLARQRVTVALSGDGGDETFGGYRRYKLHLAAESVRQKLPESVRKTVFGGLAKIYPKADWAPKMFRAKTTFSELAQDSVAAYMQTVACVREPERNRLFSNHFKNNLGSYDVNEQMRIVAAKGPRDALAMIQNLDYHYYLPGDINVKVDRASMAASLESREPLMDHTLVEWVASLPSSTKIRNGETKFLFKKAFEGHLSHELLYRPKMGFSVPLASWFRGELGEKLAKDLSIGDNFCAGYVSSSAAKIMLEQHKNGQDWATPLWTIFMFNAFIKNLAISKPRFDLDDRA
jgi:asparagine synthase (glutamine-hydrolysing)